MEEEITSIKRFFRSQHISVSDYWLESFLQWYREENPDSNYTMETLNIKVYAQWLLLDLRDVEVPILPPNLAQQKKVVLDGVFPLQMLQITDISQPKLWQLTKLRKNANAIANLLIDEENRTQNQTNNSCKRVLQMLLTDGVQEIEAIEYKPVKALNVNLTPGIKIKIVGPVTVRRGQILLEEKNINIIGGEVEELLVTNAAENILARALHMPENPNPGVLEETFIPVDNLHIPQIRNQQNTINTELLPKKNTAVATSSNCNSPKIKPNLSTLNEDFVTEEELYLMAEIDTLMEVERDIIQESKHRKTDSPDIFDDVDTDVPTIKQNQVNNSSNVVQVTYKPLETVDLETNHSIFEEVVVDTHLDLMDGKLQSVQIKNSMQPVPISHLQKNRNNITSGKFTIKAKFNSVFEKLKVVDDAWSLKLVLEDETGELKVNVHSEILSELMGYCPAALMTLKEDILNKDECATDTVTKILDTLKAKILNLDCVMDVMFTPNEESPTIVKLR